MNRVIVVGLDGFEPRLAEDLMARGELPNLSGLRRQGAYARLKTTFPAQTPVAWSTFATGTNPGRHGIFDFLSRDPRTYQPILGLSHYEQKNAFVPPKVVNSRKGKPVWNLLSERDVPSTVLRCPCTYPPDEIQGRMLAGVGVPDLRGGMGTSTFYSTEPDLEAAHSEKVINVQYNGDRQITTHLIGPRNPRSKEDYLFKINLSVDPSAHRTILRCEGQPNEMEIREGEWSEWLRVKFKIGLFQSVRGVVRFFLVRTDPQFELYASPINFDPSGPLFPLSYPEDFAKELEARLGTYYTTGMAEDHDGLNNGRFDEDAFLAQCEGVLQEREQMMLHELDRFESGLFFCLFDTPDRMQHMFWRFREPDHPANSRDYQPERWLSVEEHYRRCDSIVGKALQHVDDQTLLIVLSDHGMGSFRRGLNLNTWLYENGYLALKRGVRPGEETGDFFCSVDWDLTKAYALGLGGIFLNRKGREERGTVEKGDVESIKKAIAGSLTGMVDAEEDQVAVHSVLSREEVYSGPCVSNAPDLIVNFAPGYRVSWDTPLGGIPEGLFADNVSKWSGDHVIEPSLVPGVLFMNRDICSEDPGLIDLAPTILSALNIPAGSAMEGASLLQ